MKRGFRPSLREQMRQSLAAQKWLAAGAPDEKKEIAAAHLARMEADQLPPVRQRAAPRQLEGPVVAAISELLSVHPKILWAARFNRGAMFREVSPGRFVPYWFHRVLREPEKTRMPDFFGIMATGIMRNIAAPYVLLAVEAKAPGWTKPRDDREREQAAFLAMVRSCDGLGIFATDAEQVAEALRDA